MTKIPANRGMRPVTPYIVRMELHEPTMPTNANDANARTHAVDTNVQKIPNVPLTSNRTHNRVRRLYQSVARVSIKLTVCQTVFADL